MSHPDMDERHRDRMNEELLTLTADIVSAHVSNNKLSAGDLPDLIRNVFAALHATDQPVAPEPQKLEPAVSVRSSVKPDYIVCLEDGAKLKMLKRYLRTRFDMSPEEYRRKWNLPADYPMVAPNYAEQRRSLAHAIGLGRKKLDEAMAEPAAVAPKARRAAAKKSGAEALKSAKVRVSKPKAGEDQHEEPVAETVEG